MMPIGSLGARPPRRSTGPRIVFLAAVTAVTIGVLAWSSSGDDGAPPRRHAERSATTAQRTAATSAPTSTPTTAHPFVLDPSWVPKGSSRYSESEESKLQADELQATSTTTTLASDDQGDGAGRGRGTGGATTATSGSSSSATP
jgi:hypothetical protein